MIGIGCVGGSLKKKETERDMMNPHASCESSGLYMKGEIFISIDK